MNCDEIPSRVFAIEHWPRPGLPGADAAPKSMSWPDETKALFGLPSEADVTREVFERLVHPSDLRRFNDVYATALSYGSSLPFEIVYRLRRAGDGAQRRLRFRGYVRNDARATGRLVGEVTDVTEVSIGGRRHGKPSGALERWLA